MNPLPGTDRTWILENIREIATGASNLRGSTDAYRDYIRWANDSVRKLSRLVSPADVERSVLTRRYWLLQSATQTPTAHMQMLLNVEVDERVSALEDAEHELRQRIERWSRPGEFVVPDTSFYVTHPDKLEDLDLRTHLQITEDPVHLLVPILVIDELDGLKRSGDKHARWRRWLLPGRAR